MNGWWWSLVPLSEWKWIGRTRGENIYYTSKNLHTQTITFSMDKSYIKSIYMGIAFKY